MVIFRLSNKRYKILSLLVLVFLISFLFKFPSFADESIDNSLEQTASEEITEAPTTEAPLPEITTEAAPIVKEKPGSRFRYIKRRKQPKDITENLKRKKVRFISSVRIKLTEKNSKEASLPAESMSITVTKKGVWTEAGESLEDSITISTGRMVGWPSLKQLII